MTLLSHYASKFNTGSCAVAVPNAHISYLNIKSTLVEIAEASLYNAAFRIRKCRESCFS